MCASEGFRVDLGLGFRLQGFEFRDPRVQGSGLRVLVLLF